MAAEDGDARGFSASEPLDGPAPAISTDDALARAIAYSPDLQVITEHARAAAIGRDVAEQDLSPRLDLVLRGGPAGNADTVGDAWSQLGTFGSFEAAATLTFSMPLGNHSAKARLSAAKLRETRLGHAHDEVRGELTAAVQRALDALALAAPRIEAATKAVELARKNVDLERDRWQGGKGTNFDVLARQDQLATAEAALARAQADHRIAVAGLAYLTGEAR
jgi:outer membrane protein TolC